MTTHALFSLLLAPSGQQGGMGIFILQIGLFVAIFYFLLIRPQRQQQAKHRELMASLQRGDQVVTSGGLVGEVVHLKDNEVTLRTGDTRVVVLRSSIANITNRGTAPEVEAKK
jgi:preprotein translocase subunit YajC